MVIFSIEKLLFSSFSTSEGVTVSVQQPRLHAIPAVQDRLSIGRSKVFELIDTGELHSVKVGKRRLVSEAAIAAYIEKLTTEQLPAIRD
ncbi:MAG: helix-turn-helix domain-containing protein [Rhodococcus sp. (in: high G+C Gram-positive bacteria)]|uniref:helix-turn-helix domain-containing protein n=1 Tax=Rhodococcus sp. TaxID=1831 RepID=UPI002AD72A27|nr:helix-turn-helix domain-containing protein [Rhodococcus sp. (in: high G+C Gram-positive bacteria)]